MNCMQPIPFFLQIIMLHATYIFLHATNTYLHANYTYLFENGDRTSFELKQIQIKSAWTELGSAQPQLFICLPVRASVVLSVSKFKFKESLSTLQLCKFETSQLSTLATLQLCYFETL